MVRTILFLAFVAIAADGLPYDEYDYKGGYPGGLIKTGYYPDDGYYSYNGFKIVGGKFSYLGKPYKLTCSPDRFYSLWNGCYSSYHSKQICFRRLYKQHYFEPYLNDYSINYVYPGFQIYDGRFSYLGKDYRLRCSKDRFYSLWNDCWNGYHSKSICFNRLYKKHYFEPYLGDYSFPPGIPGK